MSFATYQPKPKPTKNASGQLAGARFASSSLDKGRKMSGNPVDSLHSLSSLSLAPSAVTSEEKIMSFPPQTSSLLHLFYDPILSQTHLPANGTEYECPERVKVIYDHLKLQPNFSHDYLEFDAAGIRAGDGRMLSPEDLEIVHGKRYIDTLEEFKDLRPEQLRIAELKYENDVYVHNTSFTAARICASGVLECCRRATHSLSGSRTAVSISRPPGHHACQNKAMGFCFLNNVAIAAKISRARKWARKVLIIDWDIHHGNGTQELTYDDPNIMYLSLHRQGVGSNYFYPGTGMPHETGGESATGSNVNITWNQRLMGNTEYICAWSELVLPVVHKFDPDLIIISSGFDAAKGDLIGDCLLTPECYFLMTRSLMTVLNRDRTAVVVALEGGYNLSVIPLCQEAVSMALKGEEWDEDAGVNPLSQLSSPQPQPKSRIALSENPLVRARLLLNKYWDYYEKNDRQRGKKLSKGACNSVNKTIRALVEIDFFKSIGLRQVKEQIEQKAHGTRKVGDRKEGRGGKGGDYLDEDALDDMFGKMNL